MISEADLILRGCLDENGEAAVSRLQCTLLQLLLLLQVDAPDFDLLDFSLLSIYSSLSLVYLVPPVPVLVTQFSLLQDGTVSFFPSRSLLPESGTHLLVLAPLSTRSPHLP